MVGTTLINGGKKEEISLCMVKMVEEDEYGLSGL